MKRSLKYRLSLSYALVALVLVASISLFSNAFLQTAFENYIIREQNQRNREMADQVARQYDPGVGAFDMAGLETVGVEALSRGMILRVTDARGKVLWDARQHNGGMCDQMLESMAAAMESRYKNFRGAYEEKQYTLPGPGSSVIGTVSVGYYGPFYFSENDAAFIATLNRALIVIGVGSLALALGLGLYMARRISHPITQTIHAAGRIARGDYHHRITTVSNTRELDDLILSINRLSAELEEQDALRKRLTADIAHELRTPLAALQGNVEALIDGVWQPDAAHLESCREEILRLTRLVSDLGRLARLEGEQAALEPTDFDLLDLAQRAALSFEPDCLEKGVTLSVSGSSQPLRADRDKIRQVLVNLLSNSLKYTPEGGRIDVRVSGDAALARLEVEDSGVGIAPEHLPHIFERFYRADPSRSSQSGGAGIGLTIVKAIVEMHGGRVTADSRPGQGTRIAVTLPRQA